MVWLPLKILFSGLKWRTSLTIFFSPSTVSTWKRFQGCGLVELKAIFFKPRSLLMSFTCYGCWSKTHLPVEQEQIMAESQLWSLRSLETMILLSGKQKLFSFELWKIGRHMFSQNFFFLKQELFFNTFPQNSPISFCVVNPLQL